MRKYWIMIVVICMVIITGCGNQTPSPEMAANTESAREVVEEPTATEIVLPTATEPPPSPTNTPVPPTPEPLPAPGPRYMHNLVYDQLAERFVLFGGTGEVECGYQTDTWTYDLNTNTWYEMNPPEAPPAGQGTMAYDIESERVVLFIGTLAGEHEEVGYADNTSGGSICVPLENPKTLIPGGETWVYDVNQDEWTRLEINEGPFGLQGTRMVYNPTADRMILFGGWYVGDQPETGAANKTWVYDLNTNAWTEMSPAESPPGRMDHAMAYDAESDRVIVWGGGGLSPIDVGDIWAYDLNSNTWEEMESEDAPRSKRNGTMVYDQLNDRVLLYFQKEFWAYDYNNNQWTLLSDFPPPLGLYWHSLVYDTANDLILQFGGGPNLHQWSNKYWVYDPNLDEWTNLRGQ